MKDRKAEWKRYYKKHREEILERRRLQRQSQKYKVNFVEDDFVPKPVNLDRYEKIEKFYDKKINWANGCSTISSAIVLFGAGLAISSMILKAEEWITSLFIFFELSFLALQIPFSLLTSYFRKKRLENYHRAEKELYDKLKKIKDKTKQLSKNQDEKYSTG